ncbi:hypothetical protein [Endozoicomonas sp. 4G]|uniref:hypothetical protein n=1 Tax=Endozoicomonas sp. 4G TaxID=2872754 RepID=UPI00207878A6|nr:hypothetical protein [Endozoicomonas sp. 4G]
MFRLFFDHYYQLFKLLALAFVSLLMQVSSSSADECSGHKDPGTATQCNPSSAPSASKDKAEPEPGYSFVGSEYVGFFIKGSIPREKAIELAGEAFQFVSPEDSPERVRCAMLVVTINIDSAFKIPLPSFFQLLYTEAIWMLELSKGSYLAIKAYTDSLKMKYVLEYFDKYNTSYGSMTLKKVNGTDTFSLRSEEALLFSATFGESIESDDTSLIENLWTRSANGHYYKIPWGTAKPSKAYSTKCQVDDHRDKSIFADVIWDNTGLLYMKRKHECSMAITAELPPLSD